MEPNVTERKCGGWLAVSPRGADLKIGVTADTEQAVREDFAKAELQWRAMLTNDKPHGGEQCQIGGRQN